MRYRPKKKQYSKKGQSYVGGGDNRLATNSAEETRIASMQERIEDVISPEESRIIGLIRKDVFISVLVFGLIVAGAVISLGQFVDKDGLKSFADQLARTAGLL